MWLAECQMHVAGKSIRSTSFPRALVLAGLLNSSSWRPSGEVAAKSSSFEITAPFQSSYKDEPRCGRS